jgi:hypothetical protein
MATDSILGLFTDPYQYLQQQSQAQDAAAQRFAQLNPMERAQYGIYRGAGQLGGAVAGALGVQDPMLQQLSTIKQLASQFDTSTSGGVAALANTLREQGLQGPALQLGQKALEMRKLEAEAQAKTMERLTNEQKNAAAIADSSGANRGTPEWTEIYKNELARLTAGSKGANIKEIGVAEGSRQPVYFDVATDTQFIMKQDPTTGKQVRVPFNGGVDRTTAKTNIGGIKLPEGESEFVKELGKLDAKQVVDATKTREAAIGELDTLKKMSELNRQQMTTGTFASGRVAVGNLLGTIGIASDKDKLATAKSEEYQKYAGNLLLDKIKKLGTNPSNTDREFIARIIPQLENSAQARQELIDYMVTRANEVINETTRLEQYARQNRGLGGYKPAVPLVSTGGVASLSDEELIRQIRAERAKQGNK